MRKERRCGALPTASFYAFCFGVFLWIPLVLCFLSLPLFMAEITGLAFPILFYGKQDRKNELSLSDFVIIRPPFQTGFEHFICRIIGILTAGRIIGFKTDSAILSDISFDDDKMSGADGRIIIA